MKKGAILVSIFCSFFVIITNVYANRDPFHSTTPVAGSALSQFPITTLTMVGTIDQNNKLWAIVRTPDQKVYPVTVGSLIGSEQGHVMQITGQQIIIQENIVNGSQHPINPPHITTLLLAQAQ